MIKPSSIRKEESFPVFTRENVPNYIDVPTINPKDTTTVFRSVRPGQIHIDRQLILTGRPDDIVKVLKLVGPKEAGNTWWIDNLEVPLAKVDLKKFTNSISGRISDPGIKNMLNDYSDLEIWLVDLAGDEKEDSVWAAIGKVYDAAKELGVVVHADPNLTVASSSNGSGGVHGGTAGVPLVPNINTGGAKPSDVYLSHWAFNSGINLEDEQGNRLNPTQRGGNAKVYLLDSFSPEFFNQGEIDTQYLISARSLPFQKTRVEFKPRQDEISKENFTAPITLDFFNAPRAVPLQAEFIRPFHPVGAHGLYVSALIQRVAPDASINMINVLNDNGDGDIFTLVCALFEVIDDASAGKSDVEFPLSDTVVNMSLEAIVSEESIVNSFLRVKLKDRLKDLDNNPSSNASKVLVDLLRQMVVGFHYVPSLRIPVQIAYQLGAVLVASAGNESADRFGTLPTAIPARYKEVIGVGASNFWNEMSSFSNYASILAPGGGKEDPEDTTIDMEDLENANTNVTRMAMVSVGNITPTNPEGMLYWWGTSFAAPLVSGLAALVISALKARSEPITPGRVRSFIVQNAHQTTHIINVQKTLNAIP